jgi:RNA polymerase sigma-70 factor (sigma-E family)
LRRLAYLLTGDWAEAEDLVQDALVRCQRRWRAIAADDPHAYVRRAVVNGASNWRRRRRLELRLSEDASVPDHAPGVDARVVLLAALRRLPVEQRQVLVLRYFEQLSEAEAALALDIPPGTVKSRTSRALEALRRAGVDTTELTATTTPCTVNSFVHLAQGGYYDDTTCHRLTTQGIFVVQCGDPTGKGTGGPGYVFDEEHLPGFDVRDWCRRHGELRTRHER